MILGVLSDSHGNTGLMLQAASLLKDQLRAEYLIHLGDDWDDKETLAYAGYAVSGVPGLWCPEYASGHIPRTRVDVFDGLKVAYAHYDMDLPPLASDVGLVLTGHTHRATIDLRKGVPHMNPGQLKQVKDRGQWATFGVVHIEDTILHLAIHGLDGSVYEQESYARA